ncbi:hypothetical protein [Desulfomonile tiedjei]|uniref:Uncharacterized protein n=1 Tax=Desulfomonile tiedjei (strain ATCC 49306 / DSM 6799 / DCB-1) TaxID=706587 RepID=I4CDY4_DESTA|nr:hypothetical protein [Desulfomonile tiedjei]AFM27775.1 hypothetical protein Desti_5173 [Desulfomonile tiedjei DSM 6799]
MCQLRRVSVVLSISFLLVGGFARVCFANPIIAPRSWDAILLPLGIIMLIGILLIVFIESGIVCVVFWTPWRLWWRVLAAVALVNLITFPTAEALWCWWNYETGGPLLGGGIDVPLLLLELLVCVAEFYLLKWQLWRLFHRGFLERQVHNGRIFCAVAIANMASFVIGYFVLNQTNFFVSTTWWQ